MHSRSVNWYIGILIILFLFFTTDIKAEDICNNSDVEQVISDGTNEQFIPPHMCVTVDASTSKIVSPEPVEEQIVVATSENESIEEQQTTEVEVAKVKPVEKEVEEVENSNVEPVNTEAPQEQKMIIPVILISCPIGCVVYMLIKGENHEES